MKRKIIFAFTIVVIALIGGVMSQAFVVMSNNMSMDEIEGKLIERVNAHTGGRVTLSEKPQVTGFPVPRITARNVTVEGKGGSNTSPAITIPKLEISLKVLPLLKGDVEIKRLSMIEPEFRISESGPEPDTSGAMIAPEKLLQSVSMAEGLGADLNAFELRDAKLVYEESGTARTEMMEKTNLSAKWSDAAQSVELSAAGKWQGTDFDLAVELAGPAPRQGGRIRLSLSRQPNRPDSDDAAAPVPAWMSCLLSFAPDQSTGAVDIEGVLHADHERISISDADFRFGNSEATGTITVFHAKDRPQLKVRLAFETLDLLSLAKAYHWQDIEGGNPVSLETACMELGDVGVTFVADELRLGQFRISDAALDLNMGEKRVDFDLRRATLAGGAVAAKGRIEKADRGVALKLDTRIDGLSVTDLGEAVWTLYRSRYPIGIDGPPRGTASAEFGLSAQGTTLASLWYGLGGQGKIHLRDGSIDGADIAATLERLKAGNKIIAKGEAPFVPVPGRTQFTSLTAALTVKDGILRAGQAQMIGENFRIGLTGKLGLEGGLMVAVGSASLFTEGAEPASRASEPIVELPFGVGGFVRRPGIAPGIPQIAPCAQAVSPARGCAQGL